MPKAKLIRIAGMWKKESQGAGVFFTGPLAKLPDDFELKEGAKLFMFENRKRTQANSPTHTLHAEDTRPAGSGGGYEDTHKTKAPEGFEGFATPEDKAPW